MTDTLRLPNDAMPYGPYRKLVAALLAKGTTTGADVTPQRVDYTRLNDYRMDRMEKTISLLPELESLSKNMNAPETWLVLTEAWCGDSAQNIPVLQKVAEASDGKIRLFLASRDANPDWMDRFTTEGGRSIPKLIRLDGTGAVLGTWGPRPVYGQQLMHEWKRSEGKISKEEFHKNLHLWYARDRGASLQQELMQMLQAKSK